MMSRRSRRHVRVKGKSPTPASNLKTTRLKRLKKVQPKRKPALRNKKLPKKLKKVKLCSKKNDMKLSDVTAESSVENIQSHKNNLDDESNGTSGKLILLQEKPLDNDLENGRSREFEHSIMTSDEKTCVDSLIVTNENQDCNSGQDNEFVNEINVETSEVCTLSTESSPICPVCKKELDSSTSLTLHMKQHNSSNQYHKCSICSKSLSSASSLDRHMLVHSGERPFKCKLCDMAFTTNGNMHRHMRTHGELSDSSDSSKTNESRKGKRKEPSESLTPTISPKKSHDILADEEEKLHCPVCGKSFLCKYGLQSHMEIHPNDPIQCQECGEICSNYTIYINHTCSILGTKSSSDNSKSVPCGFQDLTFMDFSSRKFALVSKFFCENKVKRPSSAFHIFECPKCNKSFPCGRALRLHQNVHENKLGTFCPSCHCDFETPAFLQFHQLKHRSPEHSFLKNNSSNSVMNHLRLMAFGSQPQAGKEDFLALFQLQTKQSQLSILNEIKSCDLKEENFENMDYFVHGKIQHPMNCDNEGNNDFADIQSIISLTSKTPLISVSQSSPAVICPSSPLSTPPAAPLKPELPQVAEIANSNPVTPSREEFIQPSKTKNVETGNNTFAEIPVYSCKVCCQSFKSVNALKRHNRLHIQRGSSYSCHLCSYVSVDKSTLIRHLRTHNGERPFQCIICKYAFTTKANCERHIRKRHKEFDKQEIRNSMQYNPNMALKVSEITTSDIGNSETVCKYCNVDFKFNRVLRHHLRSLHNSCNRKPFSCKICKFGFSTKNNCIRHVLKQHPSMKDKLRSVVIPNAHMDNLSSAESMGGSSSFSDVGCTDSSSPESVPLDLNISDHQETEKENKNESLRENCNNEVVIAAESLVSLSETMPVQLEPLDLAIHPLDLSVKSLNPIIQKFSSKPASIYSISTYSVSTGESSFLDLSTSTSKTVSGSDGNMLKSLCNQQESICSKLSDCGREKCINLIGHSSKKVRSFTCVYCSAGFTLKSNMERHIKRKHPEFARPTRSRNFIPSVVVRSPQKVSPTLSNKTRDALRNVLNSKVQPIHGYLSKNDVFSTKQTNFLTSDFSTSSRHKGEDTINLSLDLSAKKIDCNQSFTSSISPKQNSEENADDNSLDLASVSAVICTANSQQFKKYFDKSIFDKSSSKEPENTELQNANDKLPDGLSPSVACPFCFRKFPWTSSLRRHILTHTGQKPYKCPLCILWFTTKSNCERHLISKHGHKGDLITRTVPERPFKCTQCPTSTFSTQGNLRKHFYLKHWTKSCLGMNSKPEHSNSLGEGSIQSEVIGSRELNQVPAEVGLKVKLPCFSSPSKKNSVENFACQFCDCSFSDAVSLSNHVHEHKDIIYVCYLCQKTFPRHDTCLQHFKTSHALVYAQLSHCDVHILGKLQENNSSSENILDKAIEDSGVKDITTSVLACMICFQKLSSVDEVQQHVKSHILKEKLNVDGEGNHSEESCSIAPEDTDLDIDKNESMGKKSSVQLNKSKNSLLYLLSPSTEKIPCPVSRKENFCCKQTNQVQVSEEETDLIQNLLGIHDSKIIDEMLDSADSAARLLGVKKV